jgi:hypothetical protein
MINLPFFGLTFGLLPGYSRKMFQLHKVPPQNPKWVKERIIRRLSTEDYTCRLPDQGKPYCVKPRIRHRLKKTHQVVRRYDHDHMRYITFTRMVYK